MIQSTSAVDLNRNRAAPVPKTSQRSPRSLKRLNLRKKITEPASEKFFGIEILVQDVEFKF